jgi:serine/threonine protein phosphatase 1
MLYVVGDIHGELEKLDELFETLPLAAGDEFVFLGDYVDRGPDSCGVIERLLDWAKQWPCTHLLGNHESMFLDFLGWTDDAYFGSDAFLLNGGEHTLASYGYFDRDVPSADSFELPKAHEDFLLSLKRFHRSGDYVFVHAGLDDTPPGAEDVAHALNRMCPRELLWNRSGKRFAPDLGVTVVYGHTPAADFSVRWNLPHSIGIDTGAVYGGPLTALRLPDQTVFQV